MLHRQRMSPGAALAAVLMVVAVAILAAFTLAGSAVFEAGFQSLAINHDQATDLAESAVARAAAQIIEDQENQLPVSPTLTINTTVGGTTSYLSFVKANAAGLPWSTNNLTGAASTTGSMVGYSVPPGSVQLIGTGKIGSVERQVLAVIHFPAFPFVVSSSGPFLSPHGGVEVAQVAAFPSAGETLSSILPCCLLPGDMLSNSTAAPAIQLGPGSTVTGNVQSPGSICLSPGAIVKGNVQPGAAPVQLPKVCVCANPLVGLSGVAKLSSTGCTPVPGRPCPCLPPLPGGSVVLEGMAQSCTCVKIAGDLELNDALVYIKGNLSVSGALLGTGAVVSTGQIKVSGGSALRTTDVLALVAGGNVTLTGPGCQKSTFYGLVYSQGNFQATNMQLFGNFVANGGGSCSSCGGTVIMCNTKVAGTPAGMCITFTMCSSQSSLCACCTKCVQEYWEYGQEMCSCPLRGKWNAKAAVFVRKTPGVVRLTIPQTSAPCAPGGYVPAYPCSKYPAWFPTASLSYQYICVKVPCPLPPKCSPQYAKCVIAPVASAMKQAWQLDNPNASATHCVMCDDICGAASNLIANDGCKPFVKSPTLKVVTKSTTAVYRFNFNEYISPGDQTRVLMWRAL